MRRAVRHLSMPETNPVFKIPDVLCFPSQLCLCDAGCAAVPSSWLSLLEAWGHFWSHTAPLKFVKSPGESPDFACTLWSPQGNFSLSPCFSYFLLLPLQLKFKKWKLLDWKRAKVEWISLLIKSHEEKPYNTNSHQHNMSPPAALMLLHEMATAPADSCLKTHTSPQATRTATFSPLF